MFLVVVVDVCVILISQIAVYLHVCVAADADAAGGGVAGGVAGVVAAGVVVVDRSCPYRTILCCCTVMYVHVLVLHRR